MTIIDHDGQHVTIPRERMTRLDVNEGRKRNAMRGLLVGAAFGSALFAAALATDDSSHGSDSYFPTALLFPVVAAPLGGIGAGIGYFVKSDKWEETHLDRVRVSPLLGPSGKGGGLALTFAF